MKILLSIILGAGMLIISSVSFSSTKDVSINEVDTDGDRWAASADGDDDNDGIVNEKDIDDDGDGLIEIATAAELNAVRYALHGRGLRLSEDAKLDTTGCGGASGIKFCNGYELVADISLADYANWQPLGHDTDGSEIYCQGAASFTGIFEGNGKVISDLSINRPDEDCVGLFGHVGFYKIEKTCLDDICHTYITPIGSDSEIRNLKLRAAVVRGGSYVGGLMGWGAGVRIDSVSVVVGEVRGEQDVGGLVGNSESAHVHSSSVEAAQVSGNSHIGGLVGTGVKTRIDSSSVVVEQVSGFDSVGGLVGVGRDARIISSSVEAAQVSGNNHIGGLVGADVRARIDSSSVVAGEVRGTRRVGGLVGIGLKTRIDSPSGEIGVVRGTRTVGGLVGMHHNKDNRITSSSVVVKKVERK